MDITVETTLTLSGSEAEQLARILGCSVADLGTELQGHANAATEEYARLFLGQKVFTRGSDFSEYRLLLLIRHVFEGAIPSEQQICDLFQVTASHARSLLQAVMSKFQYDLGDAIDTSLCDVIAGAEHSDDDDGFLIPMDSRSMIDTLNRRLASIDKAAAPITKKRGTVSTYRVPPASHELLLEALCG